VSCLDALLSSESPLSVDNSDPVNDDPVNQEFQSSTPDVSIESVDTNSRVEWLSLPNSRISPVYEQNQVALFCCRETVNLRTMSWIMADEKWIELLPEMMARSEALTSIIHANAATYLAKSTGAPATPRQALTHYAYALRELQRDLYDPTRQTSDETLFAIILLGIFDVRLCVSLSNSSAPQQQRSGFLASTCPRGNATHSMQGPRTLQGIYFSIASARQVCARLRYHSCYKSSGGNHVWGS